ncbi:unnamed protein product [Paramecium sonneborni]|uniref:Uncharacterized protein n=1 Tax=Paramecium sonneborni TaxID=65129 RepID=A0A8S1PLC3_9CILI|nr:unnamed protein product [Paramecium sonneborni]CAD8103738.1 unnamed protein product [Paramecium sonneborni]CAD8127559.1 unnamed protein product [Paramecium sonneborni]CAD8127560.1 unnamed protein product [Paramecium sonneborni]
MIKVKSSGIKEIDAAKYFLEAVLQLRDCLNESKQIIIDAQGEDICVATCVLELLKNQFPNNKNLIKTSGSINDIQDCKESGIIISFQVLDFGQVIQNPYTYVEKYLHQLIDYEKSQNKNIIENNSTLKQNKQQYQQQQQQQQKEIQIESTQKQDQQQRPQFDMHDKQSNSKNKQQNKMPMNYIGDEELISDGLHGFAQAFDSKFGANGNEKKNKSRKNKQKKVDNDFQDQNFIRGNIKYRGGFNY